MVREERLHVRLAEFVFECRAHCRWLTARGSAAAARRPPYHDRRAAARQLRTGRPPADPRRTPPIAAVSCSRLFDGPPVPRIENLGPQLALANTAGTNAKALAKTCDTGPEPNRTAHSSRRTIPPGARRGRSGASRAGGKPQCLPHRHRRARRVLAPRSAATPRDRERRSREPWLANQRSAVALLRVHRDAIGHSCRSRIREKRPAESEHRPESRAPNP